jgi:hypothetical protein
MLTHLRNALCTMVCLTSVAAAQSAGSPSTAAPAARAIPPAEQQIAAAVLPLPANMRSAAAVLGYTPDGKLGKLRAGTNGMTCLASDPKAAQFHVACYHESMEPFMARGRALRASGVKDPDVDSTRFREIAAGTLKMPTHPAALYSLTGGTFDAAAGTATGARALFVVYMPGANTATTGLQEQPVVGAPWIMFPGTPKAHIMFVPKM